MAYKKLVEKDPTQKKYYKGWINRIEFFRNFYK